MSMKINAQGARLVIFGYNAVLDHIAWITAPSGPFYVGNEFNLTGGQVMAYYKDGSTSDVTDSCTFDPIAGTALDYSGEMTVTATYTDKQGNIANADTAITVFGLDSIEVTTLPDTTKFNEDDLYDFSGIEVVAHYGDGTAVDITDDCVFDPADGSVAVYGTDTVTVIYTSNTGTTASTSFGITVIKLDSIEITVQPDTTEYTEGDIYDFSGIEVTAHYADGSTADITGDCVFSPTDGSTAAYGTDKVTVTYGGKASTSFSITVKKKSVTPTVKAIQLMPTTFEESLASIRTVMSIPSKMLQRINSKKASVFGDMSLNIVLCAGNCNYSGSGSVRFALMDITPWVNREKYIYNFIDPATGVSQGIRIPSEDASYREFYPHQYFWENCSGNNIFYIVASEGELQEDEAYSTPWASDLCIGFGSDVYSYNPFSQSGKQPYQALAANYMIVDVPDPNA